MTEPPGCITTTERLPDGGVSVSIKVPVDDGTAVFALRAERTADGDWILFMPWSQLDFPELARLDSGHEVANGVIYLAAAENETERSAHADPLVSLIGEGEFTLCKACGEVIYRDGYDEPEDGSTPRVIFTHRDSGSYWCADRD